RTRLREETARLQETREAAARELSEARGVAERAQERAGAERKRMRVEVSGLIEELRREGSDVMRDLKSRSKSRNDLNAFVTLANERLEQAAPRPVEEKEAEAIDDAPLKPGDQVELNLIGLRTSEALRKLEGFLDQAFLTNQHEVRIVHGIGSGALRKAVQEYLGTSAYCSSFRQADPHHGGAGATIVEMNL